MREHFHTFHSWTPYKKATPWYAQVSLSSRFGQSQELPFVGVCTVCAWVVFNCLKDFRILKLSCVALYVIHTAVVVIQIFIWQDEGHNSGGLSRISMNCYIGLRWKISQVFHTFQSMHVLDFFPHNAYHIAHFVHILLLIYFNLSFNGSNDVINLLRLIWW